MVLYQIKEKSIKTNETLKVKIQKSWFYLSGHVL